MSLKRILSTQVTVLVDDHLDARLGATRYEFMNCLSSSITARFTEQVKIQLPQIQPKEVSNFAPPLAHPKATSLKMVVEWVCEEVRLNLLGKVCLVVRGTRVLRLQIQNSYKIKRRTGNDMKIPRKRLHIQRDWFIKPTQPQEPIDPDWNAGKTPQQGQNQSCLMNLASSCCKKQPSTL
ncbi:hypothetical protein Tco_0308453 [Tanacetum coccineum]